LNIVRKISFTLITLFLFVLFSCEKKESEIKFAIDTPNEFSVSKGDFADKIIIEWNNPPKSKNTEIFRFDSTLFEYKSIGFSETSTFVDTMAFIPNAFYYYKIRVYNSSDEISDFTNYDYGYVSDFKAPVITDIGYGASDSSIEIVWNTINGAEHYAVFRSDNAEDYANIGTTELNNYADLENLVAGKTYFYKIKAINTELGNSNFSVVDSGYILEKYAYATSFGDFNSGYGIEFDENNQIYVSDNQSGNIKVYDSDYAFNRQLVSTGKTLRGLSWSIDGDLLVVNSGDGRLLKVDDSGNTLADFFVSNSFMLRETATDSDGNIYITDVSNNDIVKLNSSGDFVKKWKMKQVSEGSSFYTSGLEILDNQVIVSGVNESNSIEIYDTDGNFINQWEFRYAAAYISKDMSGNLYFACFNSNVIKTDSKGKILAYIGNDKLQRCMSVNVNSAGIVFASDENQSNQIHVFTKN